jgi:hypothetical protein
MTFVEQNRNRCTTSHADAYMKEILLRRSKAANQKNGLGCMSSLFSFNKYPCYTWCFLYENFRKYCWAPNSFIWFHSVTWVDFIFLICDFTASVSHFFASWAKVLVSSLAEWSFQIVEASSGGNWIIGDTTMTCGISILGRGTRDLFEQENPIHWNLYTQLKLLRLMKWVWYSSCDSHEWTNKPPQHTWHPLWHPMYSLLLWILMTSVFFTTYKRIDLTLSSTPKNTKKNCWVSNQNIRDWSLWNCRQGRRKLMSVKGCWTM